MSKLRKATLVVVALIIFVGAMSVFIPKKGNEGSEDIAPPESPGSSVTEPSGEPQGSGEDVVPIIGEEERERLIPEDAVKVMPETDPFPPDPSPPSLGGARAHALPDKHRGRGGLPIHHALWVHVLLLVHADRLLLP